MTKDEVLYHWNYFCSLCKRLDETRKYVDHGSLMVGHDNRSNEETFSLEFQQLLILTCVEFENVGKIIAKHNDPNFDMKSNITGISENILSHYPQVADVEIYTDNRPKWKPLENWIVTSFCSNGSPQKRTEGIEWWAAYNEIKHHGYDEFHNATLNNAIEALGSLNVMELFLLQIMTNDTWIATSHPCGYFKNDYVSQPICDSRSLPGF